MRLSDAPWLPWLFDFVIEFLEAEHDPNGFDVTRDKVAQIAVGPVRDGEPGNLLVPAWPDRSWLRQRVSKD